MSALPAAITVFEFPGGEIHYRLPRRPSSLVRFGGLGGMAVGAFVASWPVLCIAFLLTAGPVSKGPMQRFLVLGPLLVFGPICFPLGGFLLFKGLFALAGHTEIVVRNARLYAIDRCGPLRWTRRRALDQLRGFRLENPPSTAGGEQPTEDWPSLKADLTNGKAFTVCYGYPRDWLLSLAGDLAARCWNITTVFATTRPAPISVAEICEDPAMVQDRACQPTSSTAILEQRPHGFMITIPPLGLRRGNNGFLLGWCLLWNAIALPFAAFFLPAAFRGEVTWEGTNEKISPLIACLMITPFLLIGIGSALGVSYRGRHRASIAVAGSTLKIEETTLFGNRQRDWTARDLADIRVVTESSNNDGAGIRWTNNLNILTKEGDPYRLFSYRDKTELEWIATLLRQALLPHRECSGAPASRPGRTVDGDQQ